MQNAVRRSIPFTNVSTIAVAVLTKETSVHDGTLYNADGSAVVATDSRADTYEVSAFEFGDCLSTAAVESIKSGVEQGKSVIVSRHHVDGQSHELEMLSPSGAIYSDATGMACYRMPEKPGKLYCVFPESEVCSATENRRRRRHLAAGGQCKNANNKHCQQDEPEEPSGGSCAECVEQIVCLADGDAPLFDVDGNEYRPQCLQESPCFEEPCPVFSCPSLSSDQAGMPCWCDESSRTVCQNFVMPPDCSACNL